MKKIIKKNQVIITALAIMIAVAGYINYSDTKFGLDKKEAKDTIATDAVDEKETALETVLDTDEDTDKALKDIQSLDTDITDETVAKGGKQVENPGEAVLTAASNYVAQAKISREQVRSSNKETLLGIIDNKNISDEEKQDAVASMVEMTDLAEKEAAAESLLEAKGFENIVVNLTGDTVDVVVPSEQLEPEQRAQIEDIVKRKTGVEGEKIVITPMTTEK